MIRTCKNCGENFKPFSKKHLFCSRKCYDDYYSLNLRKKNSIFQKENIFCDICKKEYANLISNQIAYCNSCYQKSKLKNAKKEEAKSK